MNPLQPFTGKPNLDLWTGLENRVLTQRRQVLVHVLTNNDEDELDTSCKD
jgi:hypothetical protein